MSYIISLYGHLKEAKKLFYSFFYFSYAKILVHLLHLVKEEKEKNTFHHYIGRQIWDEESDGRYLGGRSLQESRLVQAGGTTKLGGGFLSKRDWTFGISINIQVYILVFSYRSLFVLKALDW